MLAQSDVCTGQRRGSILADNLPKATVLPLPHWPETSALMNEEAAGCKLAWQVTVLPGHGPSSTACPDELVILASNVDVQAPSNQRYCKSRSHQGEKHAGLPYSVSDVVRHHEVAVGAVNESSRELQRAAERAAESCSMPQGFQVGPKYREEFCIPK